MNTKFVHMKRNRYKVIQTLICINISRMAGKQLFVSNIPYDCTEETFEQAFNKEYEITSRRLVRNPRTKQIRGTGFISTNNETAYNGLLNGEIPIVINGRRLKFSEYVNQKKFYKLHVRNIPKDTTNQNLFLFFQQFGALDSVKIDINYKTKESKGTATVVYNNYDDFNKVLTMKTVKFSDTVNLEVQKRRLPRRQQVILSHQVQRSKLTIERKQN